MSKILVETTGDFQFMIPETNEVIRHDGYSVVTPSSTVYNWISKGQIKVLGTLSDEATDEEFQNYLRESDGDRDLARDSFISSFPGEGQVVYTGGPVQVTSVPGQANPNPASDADPSEEKTVEVVAPFEEQDDKGDHSADGTLDDNPTKEPTKRATHRKAKPDADKDD